MVMRGLCINQRGFDRVVRRRFNAATPMELRAMRELQTLNPTPDRASDAQILFVALHSSSLVLLPMTIFSYRAQQGALVSSLLGNLTLFSLATGFSARVSRRRAVVPATNGCD
jgi:spore maturation protein SpmA